MSSLFKKMFFSAFIPVAFIILFFASIASHFTYESIRTSTNKQLENLVSAGAVEIEGAINSLQALLRSVGTLSNVQNLIIPHAEDQASLQELLAAQQKVNTYLDHLTKEFKAVDEVIAVNTKGIVVADTNKKHLGTSMANYLSVQKAISGEESMTIEKAGLTGRPYLIFSAPVFNNTSIVGALLICIDLPVLSETILTHMRPFPTSKPYVYDHTFTQIMNLYENTFGQNDATLAHIPEIIQTKTGQLYYEATERTTNGEDTSTHSLTFAHIPHFDWYVVLDTSRIDKNRVAHIFILRIFMCAFVAIALVALFLARSLRKTTSSISNIVNAAHYLSKGNITLKQHQVQEMTEIAKNDTELGKLATHVKSAGKYLIFMHKQGLLHATEQLENSINLIDKETHDLAEHISLTSQGVEEQATRITETATAMEEMSSTVLEVAKNSSSSATIAENTRQEAIEGAKITLKCKDAMSRVLQESTSLRENMALLSQHANSINTVMGVISDIADQTNLLALNAAIEAARAGDAGRGFAVVADEVRKLAEKTIASTSDVANAITAIQQSTESNVKQVDYTVKCIEEATELTEQSKETLEIILEMADLSADSVRVIATASEEQSATSDEINASISHINSIATETIHAVEKAKHTITAIAKQSREVTQNIDTIQNHDFIPKHVFAQSSTHYATETTSE